MGRLRGKWFVFSSSQVYSAVLGSLCGEKLLPQSTQRKSAEIAETGWRRPEDPRFHQPVEGSPGPRPRGDPSLRLKNGYAQDDAN